MVRRKRLARCAMWGCVGMAAACTLMWAWSGWWLVSSHWFSGTRQTDLRLMRGAVWLVHASHPPNAPISGPGWPGEVKVEALSTYYTRTPVWDRWLPRLSHQPAPGGIRVTLAEFPVWIVVAVAAASAVACWRVSRKKSAGLCAACGYDLSGSGARPCPECGTLPTPAAKQPRARSTAHTPADGELYSLGHESPAGRSGAASALGQSGKGAIDRGMGSVC